MTAFADGLKTSVVIPCYYGHFKHLPEILDCYVHQTVLPDEVIISLSEVDRIPPHEILALEQSGWPFSLKIIKNRMKLAPGQNRNIGCEHSIGDIILFQDADDLIHTQRVEIVKYFFETYDIMHLMHRWLWPKDGFQDYKKENITFRKITDSSTLQLVCFTNGNACISRKVIEYVKFGSAFAAEDVEFNNAVCDRFHKTIQIDADLLIYRYLLSSSRTVD